MLVGTIITEETIKAENPGTKEDLKKLAAIRSWEAIMNLKLQEDAFVNANSLKDRYGHGISTRICIFNATGQTLKILHAKSWKGRFFDNGYDTTIGSGQGSSILHVKPDSEANGSVGCLVYQMENISADVFIGWDTPYSGMNRFLIEIKNRDQWWGIGSEDYMKSLVEQSYDAHLNRTEKVGGYDFNEAVDIGPEASPLLKVTLSMKE